MSMPAGFGVDTAIEAVGIPATFELCEDLVAPGGTVSFHAFNAGWHWDPGDESTRPEGAGRC